MPPTTAPTGQDFTLVAIVGTLMTTMMGTFVALIWHLLRTTVPEQQKLFREQLAEERKEAREALDKVSAAHASNNAALVGQVSKQGESLQRLVALSEEHSRQLTTYLDRERNR